MKWCKRMALKVALTLSFVVTAVAAYVLPPEFSIYLVAAGAAQNTIWLWEV